MPTPSISPFAGRYEIGSIFGKSGLPTPRGIEALRPNQQRAIEWALDQKVPYLLVNAPTGSGKTLIGLSWALLNGADFSYAVHTTALQDQVARTVPLPVINGRGNYLCEISQDIYGKVTSAAEGICAANQWCPHTGRANPQPGVQPSDPAEYLEWQKANAAGHRCGYYSARDAAMMSKRRIANYSMLLTYKPLLEASPVLVCDEAHNIEEVVARTAEVYLSRRTLNRLGVRLPRRSTLTEWGLWANEVKLAPVIRGDSRPDFGHIAAQNALTMIKRFGPADEGRWLIDDDTTGVRFSPIWGRDFVVDRLFKHTRSALLMSATLLGPEFIADSLGLPDGSWTYLDLPSAFDPARHPINYAPVVRMGKSTSDGDRRKMLLAIDSLIARHLPSKGIVHAVSNVYRDEILQTSAYAGIMTSDPVEHERNPVSVLVASNMIEGWDGHDDLCRFVIMPKVPFPYLGDRRVALRKDEDSRSFDHRAVVSVVQGAGRGMRHADDWAVTYLLDESWKWLYGRRRGWLPQAFTDAYHHEVTI